MPPSRTVPPSTVCALVITSAPNEILFAVRDARSNRTFPDTISVPTQRIPRAVAEAVAVGLDYQLVNDGETFYEQRWHSNTEETGHAPIVYAVEGLLSRKLDVANNLERGSLTFEAALASRTVREALHGNLDDSPEQVEPVDMVTISVKVIEGKDQIPTSTASYSRIAWIAKERFAAAVRTKDPLVLVPDGHPAELCVQGVCTHAAARLVEAGRV